MDEACAHVLQGRRLAAQPWLAQAQQELWQRAAWRWVRLPACGGVLRRLAGRALQLPAAGDWAGPGRAAQCSKSLVKGGAVVNV